MIADTLNPNFGLPDMGDYYYDAPDQQRFYKQMDNHINSLRRSKANSASAYKFYQEDPPEPGYHDDTKTYVFEISLGAKGIGDDDETIAGIKVDDGDTIGIPMSKISAADDASSEYLEQIKKYTASSGDVMNIRFACMDAAELPHFRKVSLDSIGDYEIAQKKISEISDDPDFVFSCYESFMESRSQISQTYDGAKVESGTYFDYSKKHNDDDTLSFVKLDDGKYHQYFDDGTNAYIIVKADTNNYTPNEIADAGIARDSVANAINQADAMRIVIDGTKISRDKRTIKTMFRSNPFDGSVENQTASLLDSLFDNYTKYPLPGFNLFGQDAYGRCIAAIYVHINGVWINLNKFVIANTNNTEINKYSNSTDGSTGINADGYEYDAKQYADDIYADSKTFDDRDKVQKNIFGQSFDSLKKWTVTIGDVTLFVPPTSIRCLTQTKAERMAVVRARGTMAKSTTKAQRIIEMDVYFNEERGINGFEYKTATSELGGGKKITYWMNGLRALYAEFKLAPFLPIDNEYINIVLGVDAVTMINFSCETVPNFPRLLKATIQLSEFEYRIYMPEIPMDPGDDDDNKGVVRNYFSEQINYPLFRYYYQSLINNGEDLKDTKFLDTKFITNTFGNKTCLIPMQFKDPYIKFYIPNKDQLEKMKSAKIQRLIRPNTVRNVTPNELKLAEELAKVKNEIEYVTSQNPAQNVNDYLSSLGEDYILTTDTGNNVPLPMLYKTKGNNIVYDADATNELRSHLDELTNAYNQNLNSIVLENGMPICTGEPKVEYYISGDENQKVLSVNLTKTIDVRATGMTEEDMKQIKSLSTVNGDFSADEVFQNNSITIKYSVVLPKRSDNNGYGPNLGQQDDYFHFTNDTNDMKFLNFMDAVNEKQGVGGNEDANNIKSSIDYVDATTLQFVPYCGEKDFLVESIHMGVSNTFSQITLQETTGYAPQYMGGTDITLNISLYTQDASAAAAMSNLPGISAQFARQYRVVLAAWPLKIESEFTKLFGITDTMIESVEMDTVPNQPGLYHIALTLVSVDRSLRNREALTKKDMQNFHNLSKEGVAAERLWSYDKMSEFLSEAELYPDLELPTLKELADKGFRFIRYSNEKRVYPDPDFYFTYSYILMSQLIRETVLKSFNNGEISCTIKDSTGKQLSGAIDQPYGTWKANFDRTNGFEKDIQSSYGDSDDLIPATIISDFTNASSKTREEMWTIASTIKVALMEKRMTNIVQDCIKQKYKTDRGNDASSTESTYDNQEQNATNSAESKQQLLDTAPSSSDGPTNTGASNSTDSPDADANSTSTTDMDTIGSALTHTEQQEQNDNNKKSTEESPLFKSKVFDEEQKKEEQVIATIDNILQTRIESNGTISTMCDKIFAPFNGNAALEGDDGNAGSEEIGGNSWDRKHNILPGWFCAAADAICSNQGVDYSGSRGNTAGSNAASVAAGAAAGAATGAAAGAPIAGVGAAPGAAIGATVGAASALIGTQRSQDSKDSNAPWKFNHKCRAKVYNDNTWQELVFDKSDTEKMKVAKYNSIEFGFFDFKYYPPDELIDKFGYYGRIKYQDDDSSAESTDSESGETTETTETTKTAEEDKSDEQKQFEADTADVNPDIPRWGYYLADPLYRKCDAATQADYVEKCMTDFDFAQVAFFRICLLHFKNLVNTYKAIPSFAYDIFSDALTNEEKMKKIIENVRNIRAKKEAEENAKAQQAKTTGTSKKWNNTPKEVKADTQDQQVKASETNDPNAGDDNTKKSSDQTDKADQQNGSGDDANKSNNHDSSDQSNSSDSSDSDKKTNENANEDNSSADNKNKARTADEIDASTIAQYKKLFQKNKIAVDNGKLFIMLAMGILDGDKDFVKLLVDRDYDSLNAITTGAKSGTSIRSDKYAHQYEIKLRSFIKALGGEGVIDPSWVGNADYQTPSSSFHENNARKNVAAASEDPRLYYIHSFYDMIVHDCRGRMLRAFPTFYMFLIDEGRKTGRWKLHDNFYNVNAISSITISQSRKIPTDTAEVVMTNFFNTYTTNDEDLNANYTSNFTDVFNSIWLPTLQSYAESEEQKRTDAQSVERMRLNPGARIHIRLGYGADASHLPISFNGMIAELETGDTIKLICQSDGAEICKPIMLDKKAYELRGEDSLFGTSTWTSNGDTPKSIMRSLLCMHGGAINTYLHDKGWDSIGDLLPGFNSNPLGIYHFGNPDIKYAGDAEPVQNIFEVGLSDYTARYMTNPDKNIGTGRNSAIENGLDAAGTAISVVGSTAAAAAGGALGSVVGPAGTVAGAMAGAMLFDNIIGDRAEKALKAPQQAPQINFEVFGKTVWDCVNICRSIDPGYYAAVLPFHLRSTLFIGKPNDYYAYDYENVNGTWVEKRKPFQQCHLYTSLTDIIDNRIAVSTKDMKTCAVGLYEVYGFMADKVQKRTDPQWVDAAIYPEFQKTMYVDTKLYGMPSRKLGLASDVLNHLTAGVTNSTFLDRGADDDGEAKSNYNQAVKMTISALKDGMKEMYQGQFTIIGDPSIKPQDRIILNDTYNVIGGQVLARDVVQVFSVDQGYKTVITPDLITSQVGNPAAAEMRKQSHGAACCNTAAMVMTAYGAWAMSNKAYATYARAMDYINKSNITQKAKSMAEKTAKAALNKSEAASSNAAIKAIMEKANQAKVTKLAKGAFSKTGKIAGSGLKAIKGVLGATPVGRFLKIGFMIGSVVGLGAIENMVEDYFKSRKRLIVFPLQKYGRPMIGGLDGNIGSVYGAPNFNSKDAIQSILSAFEEHADQYAVTAAIYDCAFGENGVIPIAQTYKMNELDKIANQEGLSQQVYSDVNKSAAGNYSRTNFNPLIPRIDISKQKRSGAERTRFTFGVNVKEPERINEDGHMKDMVTPLRDTKLSPYMTLGYFRVTGNERGFTSDVSDKIKCIYIKTPSMKEAMPVNAIVDSNGIYDIPFLHNTAEGVLVDVVKKSFDNLTGTEQMRDQEKWYQDNQGSILVLASALKPGSEKSYESTGFSIVLMCSNDKVKTATVNAINQINDSMKKTHESMSNVPESVMKYKENGNEIFVLIAPPEANA